MGSRGPAPDTWLLGPTRVNIQSGIMFGSAAFAGVTVVTDRPTDHATPSVATDRLYSCAAMRPSNNNVQRLLRHVSVVKRGKMTRRLSRSYCVQFVI